jgi:hypothetical protein
MMHKDVDALSGFEEDTDEFKYTTFEVAQRFVSSVETFKDYTFTVYPEDKKEYDKMVNEMLEHFYNKAATTLKSQEHIEIMNSFISRMAEIVWVLAYQEAYLSLMRFGYIKKGKVQEMRLGHVWAACKFLYKIFDNLILWVEANIEEDPQKVKTHIKVDRLIQEMFALSHGEPIAKIKLAKKLSERISRSVARVYQILDKQVQMGKLSVVSREGTTFVQLVEQNEQA